MAYAGAAPWHGLDNQLTQKQPIEVWQREAGMDWAIQESPIHFKADTVGHLGSIHSFPGAEAALPFGHQGTAVGGFSVLPYRAASGSLGVLSGPH